MSIDVVKSPCICRQQQDYAVCWFGSRRRLQTCAPLAAACHEPCPGARKFPSKDLDAEYLGKRLGAASLPLVRLESTLLEGELVRIV